MEPVAGPAMNDIACNARTWIVKITLTRSGILFPNES
jgi:hypothetical protein